MGYVEDVLRTSLPNFEYQGYTYYVHDQIYMGDARYREVEKTVKKLDSHGCTNWFIPTIDELQAAADSSVLPKLDYDDSYISSSSIGPPIDRYYFYLTSYSSSKYSWRVTDDDGPGWTPYDWHVCPMARFRVR